MTSLEWRFGLVDDGCWKFFLHDAWCFNSSMVELWIWTACWMMVGGSWFLITGFLRNKQFYGRIGVAVCLRVGIARVLKRKAFISLPLPSPFCVPTPSFPVLPLSFDCRPPWSRHMALSLGRNSGRPPLVTLSTRGGNFQSTGSGLCPPGPHTC